MRFEGEFKSGCVDGYGKTSLHNQKVSSKFQDWFQTRFKTQSFISFISVLPVPLKRLSTVVMATFDHYDEGKVLVDGLHNVLVCFDINLHVHVIKESRFFSRLFS